MKTMVVTFLFLTSHCSMSEVDISYYQKVIPVKVPDVLIRLFLIKYANTNY